MRLSSRASKTVLAVLAVALVAPVSAFAGAHAARSHTVTLKNIAFHPGTVKISRGESVTWSWRDGENEHNVTGKGFHSRTQTKGSYTVRFTRTGTFNYRCTIHAEEGMRGKIIVH